MIHFQTILTVLVLDFGLHIFNRVRGLDFKGDGLARESLDKNLHSTTQTKDKVKGGLLLNVVVTQSAAILKLLASENQTLLIRRNSC